jgi:hypothetical protein
MDRIYNPEVIPDPREFTEGDPQTGIPATPLAAKWLNDLQEEVCAVIEAHAGVLDPNNRNQLRDAILDWVNHADADKVDGVPIEMAGAADGYLLKVTGVFPNLQVTAVPASSIATPAQVARRWFSSTTEAVMGTTYYRASDTAPTGTSVSVVNTVTTANVENKIAEFISAATTTGFTLDKGLWSLRLWQRASNAGTELRLKYFILNEATGIRAEVGLSHRYPIENTTDELGIYEVNVPTTLTIAPGERLGIGLYSYSASNNRTVTVSFDGADRQSYIELPVVLNHNDLAGLQGGAGAQRYHLSADELSQVQGLPVALGSKQPLDDTLTAIAGLVTTFDKLPYFTGPDAVALTTLTNFARTILAKTTGSDVLYTLGVSEFMRGLLFEPTATDARVTLEAAKDVHTHTAAEGNADLIEWSGYGQVGTPLQLVVVDTAAPPGNPGAVYTGAQLRWANAAGDHLMSNPAPAGSWKALCLINGGTGIGTEKATGIFVRII